MKSDNGAISNVIAVFLTIMVLVVTWKLVLPSYSANKVAAANLETEIVAAQDKIQSLDQTKSDLSDIDSAYKAITVSIASDADEANLITELEAIALKNSIVLPTISISAADSTDVQAAPSDGSALAAPLGVSPVTISINVSGNFDQLNSFIAALEKSVKFMNIKSTNFALAEDGSLALSLQLEAYAQASTTAVAQ